jgi:2-alkenal reductase
VIGINAQIQSASGTGNDSGIGFAIPIDAAKRSAAQLIASGRVNYAYVGITTENMTPSLARALGYSVHHGALIVAVNGGSPADEADLRGGTKDVDVLGIRDLATGGDVIVAIDGTPVRGADDVVRLVSFSLEPKQVAVFTVVRDGVRKKIAVTLAARPLPTG